MKFLCVCQYGHSRSVCLSRVLHGMGHSAVATGWSTCGDAIIPLSEWADLILLVCGHAVHRIPPGNRFKCVDMTVGPDRWQNPYSPELTELFQKLLKDRLPEVQQCNNGR